MDNITVMIIDELAFFRFGVRQALSQQFDFKTLDCDPAQDPIKVIEAELPDVVVLSSDLAAISGLELSRKIAQYYPNAEVIMLSPNPNDEELFEVVKTAAAAYLNKNITAEGLSSAIRRAYSGEYPINDCLMSRPTVAWRVLKQSQDIVSRGKIMEGIAAPLTNRETQILNYIAYGKTNKQIADILEISEQTVKTHVSDILYRLHANHRAHAVAVAMRWGWLSGERKHKGMVAVS